MDNDEKLHKELDLIQSCITRMANNSFMIKGWTLTLFVALITFFNLKNLSDIILIIALFTIIILFGYLDAFYLLMERKYTSLYSHVRKVRTEKNDFENLYDLNAEKYNNETVVDVIINKKYQIKYIKGFIKKHRKDTSFKLDEKTKKNIKKQAFRSSLKRNTILIFYTFFLCFLSIYAIYAFCNIKINKSNAQKNTYEITVNGAHIAISELDEKISNITTKIEQVAEKNNFNILKLQEDINSMNKAIKEVSESITSIDNQFGNLQKKQTELSILINNFKNEVKQKEQNSE